MDDGKTWTDPKPSQLVHPDAPPMVFHLSDGKKLISFHHNRHIKTQYIGLTGKMDGMRDRAEIWVSLSGDGGRSWSEPQFLFTNAAQSNPEKNGWFNHNSSYMDAVIDDGTIHLFLPPLGTRALYMPLDEKALATLPTIQKLASPFDTLNTPDLTLP